MELTPFVERLRQDLSDAAAAGGAEAQAAAERLALALDPATRMMLLEALSQATAEISGALDHESVDVRMSGREPEFVVTHLEPAEPPAPPAPPAPPSPPEPEDDNQSRITLRLPESVKARAEEAATRIGQSLNGVAGRGRARRARRQPGRPRDRQQPDHRHRRHRSPQAGQGVGPMTHATETNRRGTVHTFQTPGPDHPRGPRRRGPRHRHRRGHRRDHRRAHPAQLPRGGGRRPGARRAAARLGRGRRAPAPHRAVPAGTLRWPSRSAARPAPTSR